MKLVKLFSLAAVAAMVAMAFVGASSASAEPEHPEIVLCKVKVLTCNELKNWASDNALEIEDPETKEILKIHDVNIHVETLGAEPPKLVSSLGTVECEKSLSLVTLLNKLAALVEGHLLALNFEGCKLGKTKCEVTVNALGGLSLTPAETKLLAIAESISLEGRTTNATVKCGSLINCTYQASAETELTVHSDAEGHLLLLAVETPLEHTGGGICPSVSKWNAVYHAINLDEALSLRTGLWIEL
jgi:hypothetical protein